jgi:hypothetical protein
MTFQVSGQILSVALSLLLTVALVQAAEQQANELRARYQQELAICQSGKSGQQMSTCQREAAAAFAAAKRGDLDDGPAAYARNAYERCMALPALQRGECMQRMQGQGTTEGSVAGGGILRELVVPQAAAPAASDAKKD